MPNFTRRRWIAIACCLLICAGAAHGAESAAIAVELARDGKALLAVTVGERASEATKSVAAELASHLGRMSGAEFHVETGDGGGGIVIGRAGDFARLPFAATFGTGPLEREDYVLRSTDRGLYLVGATDKAVSHATWDLLYRLGYRQFFPGETWEVVPESAALKIAVDERQSPSFAARRIWYNWGFWGYNEKPYAQWCTRNRTIRGFELNSGHSYEGIIAAHRAEFEKHPEYLALVGGKREMRGDAKFCIANPGLRKLVVNHAIAYFKTHPDADSISMDPSDGGGWCECDACQKMGGVSDRVVTLANEVAAAINAMGLGDKYVGIYAYNKHSAPPHVRVDPHVIPSATTAFIGGGLSFNYVVAGWQVRGATMGVYDYLSVVDWDWNLPRGGKGSRPAQVAQFLVSIHDKGVRFYDAESGDCWGPCGLGYYVASRVMWDVNEAKRVDAIVEDFLDKAFGKAKEPMHEFYRLINQDTQRRSPSDIVGRMYRQLDLARRATADAGVLKRIDDLILYTRHAELYYALANGSGSVEGVARHAYRMHKTEMVHSYGLWSKLLSQKAALTPGHPLKSEQPFTPEELSKILADGIAKNQPAEPGFVGVEFSGKLVPAAARLKFPAVAPGSFPTEAQDHQKYFIWMPEGGGSVDLKIAVQKVWANRMPKVELFSPLEVTSNAVATDESGRPDGVLRDITLKTPHGGLHRIVTVDGGDFTRIDWPRGMAVTVESGIDTPEVTSQFRGPCTLYFYVPRGTKIIGGWASRIANWAPRISGRLLDPAGGVAMDFAKVEEGYFSVAVPEGQDGKLWKFEQCIGQRLLMTVPPYLARSGEELLLPEEVIKADEK